jgi:hypothetical protein
MTFAEKVLQFYRGLRITSPLPQDVVVLDPYADDVSFEYCGQFYRKFFGDNFQRTMILGINPGRHGGGVTGIPFTDPLKLEQDCGVNNPFKKKPELSADFIYNMINAYGGPQEFYRTFYFSAISPLGFTKGGKNLNYYDIKELKSSLSDFIVDSLMRQLSFGINRNVCFCLGEGENFKYLNRLNEDLHIFNKIVPLAHPRFIMQYRRKKMSEYVDDYIKKLNEPD